MKQNDQGRGDLIDRLRADWQRERPELDTDAMDVVGRLLLAGEALRKSVGEVLADFGLGYTDLDVLASLRRTGHPYTLRPADLLDVVLIKSGSLTACLDRLEKMNAIERVDTPGDRRSRSVQLTEKGRALVDRAIEARFQEATDSTSRLNKKEKSQLEALLRKLLAPVQGDK